MSKGSTRRPSQVSDKQFAENWDRAFGGSEMTIAEDNKRQSEFFQRHEDKPWVDGPEDWELEEVEK